MAPHIAMALANASTVKTIKSNYFDKNSTPKPAVIVISAGEDSFEHFSPYPKEITGNSNYAIVFHPHIEQNPKEYINIAAALGRGYDDRFDISEITVRAVLDKINKILQK